MNKYKNAVVGQMTEFSWSVEGENSQWLYGVIEYIFDDRMQILLEDGTRYLHVTEVHENENDILYNQPTKSHLALLSKDGKPVMAKKKLFGGYTIKPQK